MAAATGECIRARFMNNNLCCSATLTASSEAAGFPVSNLIDPNRSKSWRATGFFEVDSTNQNFYIDDGVPKTVAITNGQYLSGTALAAQIQTDLNGASSGWSVTYDTVAYKFIIDHPTATLVLSSAASAIWDTLGFVGASDVVLSGALLADEVRIHSFEYILIESSSTAWDIGFLGLITELASVMGPSSSATIQVQLNNVNVWTAPPVDITITPNDQGYMTFFDDGTQYKFARLKITDRTNANGPAVVSGSYLYVGDYLTFTSTNISRGFTDTIVDPTERQESQSGRLFFKERRKYFAASGIQIQLPTQAEKNDFKQFVYDYGINNPFFLSIDPGLSISSELVEFTRFVYFDSLPNFNHVFIDRFNIAAFSVREVV
jgi:hypothetical protein